MFAIPKCNKLIILCKIHRKEMLLKPGILRSEMKSTSKFFGVLCRILHFATCTLNVFLETHTK